MNNDVTLEILHDYILYCYLFDQKNSFLIPQNIVYICNQTLYNDGHCLFDLHRNDASLYCENNLCTARGQHTSGTVLLQAL